ncbi:MAG: protease complex subunit PrcB family protein [Candidatus Hermodarchaeota archaeon]
MRGSFKIVGGCVLLFLALTTSVFILLAFEPLKELGLHSPLTEDNTTNSPLTEDNTTNSPLTEDNTTNSPLIEYGDIQFEIVGQGSSCGIFTRANYTITEFEVWEKLWIDIHRVYYPIPELPPIDFATDIVFAVFQGERPTGGYMTNITRIMVTETSYEVYIDEHHPGDHCVTTQVSTQPYHIVKVSNFPQDLPVQFVYNIIVDNCGS